MDQNTLTLTKLSQMVQGVMSSHECYRNRGSLFETEMNRLGRHQRCGSCYKSAEAARSGGDDLVADLKALNSFSQRRNLADTLAAELCQMSW